MAEYGSSIDMHENVMRIHLKTLGGEHVQLDAGTFSVGVLSRKTFPLDNDIWVPAWREPYTTANSPGAIKYVNGYAFVRHDDLHTYVE